MSQNKWKITDSRYKTVIPPSGETARVELSESVERSHKPWLYFLRVGFPGLVVKDSFGLYIWIGQKGCLWARVEGLKS